MKKLIFGYRLGSGVYLDIENKWLINAVGERHTGKIRKIKLRETMLRLLKFIIENSEKEIIYNEEIIIDVFESKNLLASNQRLWQVMKELKFRLAYLGIPDDFILKSASKGYYVKDNMITTLYYDA